MTAEEAPMSKKGQESNASEAGPSRDRSSNRADESASGGSARYGQTSGSGRNEPKHHERKEQREDRVPRQGGDQTRGS
jgi:hypothetical protein